MKTFEQFMESDQQKITVKWKNRQGHEGTRTGTVAELEKRLEDLEDQEAVNKKYAPTDSGLVRNTRQAEIDAIRKALENR